MKKIFFFIVVMSFSNLFAQSDFRFFINNIDLPVSNRGVLGDTPLASNPHNPGKYDSIGFMYSGGFFLSGKDGDSIWTNAMAAESRIEDYLPGKVGPDTANPLNRVYTIYSTGPDFGESWQNWKDAVSLGALFYDGDNDGIYNPVDLNGNSVWDTNEDRPDLLGDLTAWCVYNDGKMSNLRMFKNISPKGIEIHQTLFAYGLNISGPTKDIIFIRYRIINTGIVSSQFDSVYFSANADPDLGFYADDLVGCDTLLNLGYAYNSGDDPDYGINPPAMAIPLLQGPIAYISNETFIDNNSNNVYDKGIDIPTDTATSNNGWLIGSKSYPGAKNLCMTSFMHHKYKPLTPGTSSIARNYMMGRLGEGSYIDPCDWSLGSVMGGVNCNDVNSIFPYSGDPITEQGWINVYPTDYRIMVNTGPFKLKTNEPMDFWIAYIVGRGTDSLNSLLKVLDISTFAHDFYKTNFSNIAVGVENENYPSVIEEFRLLQNYPNPFNPSTTIEFALPVSSKIKVKVYNLLGQTIKVLYDGTKDAGYYKFNWNSDDVNGNNSVSSGVYFYELSASGIDGREFNQMKKMILIK